MYSSSAMFELIFQIYWIGLSKEGTIIFKTKVRNKCAANAQAFMVYIISKCTFID